MLTKKRKPFLSYKKGGLLLESILFLLIFSFLSIGVYQSIQFFITSYEERERDFYSSRFLESTLSDYKTNASLKEELKEEEIVVGTTTYTVVSHVSKKSETMVEITIEVSYFYKDKRHQKEITMLCNTPLMT